MAGLDVWLDQQVMADSIRLAPMVRTREDGDVAYRFKVLRQTTSGNNTSTSQSGKMLAKAGKDTVLTTLVIDRSRGNRCEVWLEIEQNGELVSKHQFQCGE